ncbi:MAG: nucleoid-associated protein [Cyclobacteriaceae bacterium]|nr:nucleoid-associated protein [Cyclobacteriaceae bacterium]
MINILQAQLSHLSAHTLGNKTNGEDLIASRAQLELPDEDLRTKLSSSFLGAFNSAEYYHFTSTDGDFRHNPMFQWVQEIFETVDQFHVKSVSIAKHLYEVSVHPLIKSGDLFVAMFSNIQIDGTQTEALGIFKSENKSSVLKLTTKKDGRFEVDLQSGINLDKLDKGCLIYNLDEDKGYRLSILDRSGKSADAQYWKELFLRVEHVKDEFQATRNVLDIARHFVVDQIGDEFELSKADQIDYLNKSIGYFKKKDEFNQKEFEQEVFEDPEVIKSFRKFDNNFREQFSIDREDGFSISAVAVKKQSRVFKSVLKLDKNFHIYIHGDRELIERGVDEDGRKYYKIYYKQEL